RLQQAAPRIRLGNRSHAPLVTARAIAYANRRISIGYRAVACCQSRLSVSGARIKSARPDHLHDDGAVTMPVPRSLGAPLGPHTSPSAAAGKDAAIVNGGLLFLSLSFPDAATTTAVFRNAACALTICMRASKNRRLER